MTAERSPSQIRLLGPAEQVLAIAELVYAAALEPEASTESTIAPAIMKPRGRRPFDDRHTALPEMTNADDLAVGRIGVERHFGVAASNGAPVVAASQGNYNDNAPGVVYWTAP